MGSDPILQIIAAATLITIALGLIFAAVYGIFGKPATAAGIKRKTEVISGFRLAGKMIASFLVACVLAAGLAAIRDRQTQRDLLTGSALIVGAVLLMSCTVKFWVVGFRYFVGNGAGC